MFLVKSTFLYEKDVNQRVFVQSQQSYILLLSKKLIVLFQNVNLEVYEYLHFS